MPRCLYEGTEKVFCSIFYFAVFFLDFVPNTFFDEIFRKSLFFTLKSEYCIVAQIYMTYEKSIGNIIF
jgi:hypothetical protein